MKLGVLCALAGLAILPTAASADFVDGFEAYAAGSNLHGQGGWKGWDNDPAHAGTVSNAFAHTGVNSAQITTPSATAYGDDLTHEFTGATSGQWNFTAWQFIPANTPSGAGRNTYFILMNTYTDVTGPVFYDDVALHAVPAPAGLGLLALGGLLGARRRRA